MKRLSLLSIVAFFTLSAILFTSCDDTGTNPSNANAPILDLVAGDGYVSTDVTVEPGTTVKLKINAIKGDNPIKTVRFEEDGALVSDFATRLKINGAGASSSNILILNDAEKAAVNWEVEYTAPTTEKATTFTIKVTDDAGNSDAESVVITTKTTSEFSFKLTESAPYNWFDVTVSENSLVGVQLVGVKGQYDLSTLAVYEDGVLISDNTRLRIGDYSTNFTANPLSLEGAMTTGFTTDVWVKSHTGQGVTKEYKFELKDANNQTLSVGFKISTPAAQSDVTTKTGQLLNAAGPAGTGGLDLDTGNSVGSNDATADIKDSGIDNSLPLAQNWIQKIQPAGNYTLTKAAAVSEFPITFDQIQYKTEITAAFNASTQISQSDVVNIGDVFLLHNGTTLFILKCTNINVTADNNNDYYTFDVKF